MESCATRDVRVVCRAEQKNVVGRDRVAAREVREPPFGPDLVAAEYPAMALDRLHQRAGFALLRRRAFAVAVREQRNPRRIDDVRPGRKAVPGVKAAIERQRAPDPLELRDDTGQRADVPAIARKRLRRRNRSIAAAGRDVPSAGAQPGRCRAARGIAQLAAAASRALRPCLGIMARDRGAQQIETDDITVQVMVQVMMQAGAEAAGDRLVRFRPPQGRSRSARAR